MKYIYYPKRKHLVMLNGEKQPVAGMMGRIAQRKVREIRKKQPVLIIVEK